PHPSILAVVPVVTHHEVAVRGYRGVEHWRLPDHGIHRWARAARRVAAAVIPPRFAAIAARGRNGARKQRYRAQHGVVHVGAELLLGKLHIDVATIVVGSNDLERHGLAIDRNAIVPYLHMIARKPYQALDVVHGRIARIPEYHHIPALRLAYGDDLAVDDRQAQAVGVLVDDDEIPVQECRHHGIGG